MLGGGRTSRHRPVGRRAFIVPVVVALALSACVGAATGPSASSTSPSGSAASGMPDRPSQAALDRIHQQAQDALARWAAAIAAAGEKAVVPVGELTGQVGDWELEVGSNNKSALYAGLVEAPADLKADAPSSGVVQWPDGSTQTVSVITARQAIADIKTDATSTCPECSPLRITGARLTTRQIDTSRGPATAPAWEYTVQGTNVKVTRVAISARVAVVPPPWDSFDPPVGMSFDSATGTVDGRALTVTFIGAPGHADKACGEDYTAEAVESALAVVVIVTAHSDQPPAACALVGAERTATAQLAAPLGNRAVLEVRQGLPVPVVLEP